MNKFDFSTTGRIRIIIPLIRCNWSYTFYCSMAPVCTIRQSGRQTDGYNQVCIYFRTRVLLHDSRINQVGQNARQDQWKKIPSFQKWRVRWGLCGFETSSRSFRDFQLPYFSFLCAVFSHSVNCYNKDSTQLIIHPICKTYPLPERLVNHQIPRIRP